MVDAIKDWGIIGILLVVIYILIKDVVIPLIRQKKPNFLQTGRVKTLNPNEIPGKADVCIETFKKIVEIETEIKNIKEAIKDIRDRKK